MARFAERMGFRAARTAIQIDGMDEALRNGLWNIITKHLFPDTGGILSRNPGLTRHIERLWQGYFKKPVDTIDGSWSSTRGAIKNWFFQSPWFDVYDFLEFCADEFFDEQHRDGFVKSINQILAEENSGFRFVGSYFIRNTSEQELAAIDAAQNSGGKFEPVAIHIRAALDHLTRKSKPDFRNSIKESVSAVEAACCVVTGNVSASLGKALKQLDDKGIKLHPALRDAFSKLYGYTSDSSGIRHALLDEETLTYQDALFMLVTCSAFVNYLQALAGS
ncbi:MAG TPA: hypothetical protein VGG27_10720 [Magnetospirillaceae bacterium]|jgi:hypothetical protein